MSNSDFVRPVWGQKALLLVPKSEHHLKWKFLIKQGSAIVGYRRSEETAHVYYEGNLYNASNLTTFRERAVCAYGRMTNQYPTVAQAMVDLEEFEIVGEMTATTFELKASAGLDAWTNLDSSKSLCGSKS